MAHKIIGTAGHIDHGKSSLVKALTGTDPDRLSEEQERGMTIDLGFAFLSDEIAFIDVPGHEKFIKNMVAGVSTVDIAMLVIAADDGVMPQTREHLDILSLLHVKRGLVALTKIDMVEDEWLDIVEEDIRQSVKNSFLRDAPILRASAITGQGIEELRAALEELGEQSEPRQDRGIFWMPIDRSFSIKGYGTVVTGSVLSGRISVGEICELLPQKKTLKIRGIQTHGKSSQHAELGDRAALNLQNISKDDIERGNVLATVHHVTPTKIVDAIVSLLPHAPRALAHRSRVRLHLGTREIMARVKVLGRDTIEPGDSAYVQFMLEETAVAQKRDPFVVRQYSPQLTIGGGILLDVNPKPHKRTDKAVIEQLQKLESFDPVEIVVSLLLQQTQPMKLPDLEKLSGFDQETLKPILSELHEKEQVFQFGKAAFLHKAVFEKIKNSILQTVETFHQKEPLRPGIKKANLLAQTARNMPQVFESALKQLVDDGLLVLSSDMVKFAEHEIHLNAPDQQLADSIYHVLLDGMFATPPVKVLAQQLQCPVERIQFGLQALLGLDKIVRFEGDIFFSKTAIDAAREKLRPLEGREISVSEFREMLETSRKFAMPLLTYFDEIGVTERVGDARIIKKG